MATVVNLSKGNTYLASLFMWCMSGAPPVFDGKHAPMTSYSYGAPRVVDG